MPQHTIVKNTFKEKIKAVLTKDRLEFAISIYVALNLFAYGFGKMAKVQFTYDGPLLEKTIGDLNGFELTWVFFGHSYPYVIIIGMTQVIGAAMLIPKVTRIFGTLILIPVMVNIVLIDVFYGIHFGATMNAIYFLVGLLLILLLNKSRVLKAIETLIIKSKDRLNLSRLLQYILIALIGILVLEGIKIFFNNIIKLIL